MGVAPLDYGPVLLRMPFGSRLTADTLPSGCPCGRNPTVGASPWPCPSFPTSCPCRVRHGRVPQPTRHYPHLWIHRPSSERSRDFNPPDQNAAQHTLRGAPTPRRPSCRASLPSLGGTTAAPVFRSRGRRVPRPRAWSWSPGTSGRDLPRRRLGLPGSWGTPVSVPRSPTPAGPRTPGPLRHRGAAFR